MEVTSQLDDFNGIAGSKTTTDTIQITKAIGTIAELLAPFVWCVLAGKHGRILQIIPRLQKVVKDLDSVFRVAANAKIINKKDPDLGVVLQPLGILFQFLLLGKSQELIQQIAVINNLAAVVLAAGFIAKRRHEI